MKIQLIKSFYVGDITQLGYDPTTSFIITYIAKLVHAQYNISGEMNIRLMTILYLTSWNYVQFEK